MHCKLTACVQEPVNFLATFMSSFFAKYIKQCSHLLHVNYMFLPILAA